MIQYIKLYISMTEYWYNYHIAIVLIIWYLNFDRMIRLSRQGLVLLLIAGAFPTLILVYLTFTSDGKLIT